MKTTSLNIIVGLIVGSVLMGCSTAPKTSADRTTLKEEAKTTLADFKAKDASLDSVLSKSVGYAVFPDIGKGGLIAGAAYGKGTVYEGGKLIGYADMRQGSVGAQIGGQVYSELLVFQTAEALYKLKNNNFTFGASAKAVALEAGTAAGSEFKDGVAVFMHTKGGLMADASLSGQKFTFVPLSVADEPSK